MSDAHLTSPTENKAPQYAKPPKPYNPHPVSTVSATKVLDSLVKPNDEQN